MFAPQTVARWHEWSGNDAAAAETLRQQGYTTEQIQQFLWWNRDYAPFGGALSAPTSTFTIAKGAAIAGLAIAVAVSTWIAFRG